HIGWLATIALLVVISACGPRLVRRQGMAVWRRARHRIEEGEAPGREAIDGVLLLIAGGLLTFPGFLTGILGASLLLPPVRAAVRAVSAAWLARKVRKSAATMHVSIDGRPWDGARLGGDVGPRAAGGPVLTAESHPLDPPRRPLPPTDR
ncbi:MAG: FxsA family protein, partial [Actinomycetota bacterium]|nr:FxsA family protein [Actinomycetota bacterium]